VSIAWQKLDSANSANGFLLPEELSRLFDKRLSPTARHGAVAMDE
jgi:hypothetical protein